MALCHITGTVQLPDGTNAAGRILVFKRNPETVVAQSGHGIVPDEIAVKVAADGTVDFKLYTGNYIGFLRNQRAGNERVFEFPVPEASTALFQDILQAVDPVEPLPSWLTEAFEARDDADGFAADAEAAADRAEVEADRAASYGTPLGYISPIMLGPKTADNTGLLVAWLNHLQDTGLTGWVDQDYPFANFISFGGAVKIRGPFSNDARLIYTGAGDGIELTGAIDIDGVIVDGGLPSSAIPELNSEEGCLFGIHGPMSGVAGYLSGVRIGRVRAQNTRRRLGLALINLDDLQASDVSAIGCYGNGIMLSGLKDSTISKYLFDKIGNLSPEGTRLGAGIAYYKEADSSKTPAGWYVASGVMPSVGVNIGAGFGSRTTDTSIYVHDTYSAGLSGVRFGHYQGYLIGKDGVKFRGGSNDVHMSSCQIVKVALRAAVIEDAGTADCAIMNIDADLIGYDALGEWLGGNKNYTGGTGAGQTLNMAPSGIMFKEAKGSRITGFVRRINDAPDDNSEGRPFHFESCTGCELNINVDTADGIALLRNLDGCVINAVVKDVRRNGLNASAAVYCDDNKQNGNFWETKNSSITVVAFETQNTPQMDYPLRINGDGFGYDVSVEFDASKFSRPDATSIRADIASFRRLEVSVSPARTVNLAGTSFTPNVAHNPAYLVNISGSVSIANPSTKWLGARLSFKFTQDATGGRVVSFGSDYRVNWTPDTGAGKMNCISFLCDGTSWIQASTAIGL